MPIWVSYNHTVSNAMGVICYCDFQLSKRYGNYEGAIENDVAMELLIP